MNRFTFKGFVQCLCLVCTFCGRVKGAYLSSRELFWSTMGITWRIAMPLLSTLAALVILVSSAEDNLERDYQYELRPRALAISPDYDQVHIIAKHT